MRNTDDTFNSCQSLQMYASQLSVFGILTKRGSYYKEVPAHNLINPIAAILQNKILLLTSAPECLFNITLAALPLLPTRNLMKLCCVSQLCYLVIMHLDKPQVGHYNWSELSGVHRTWKWHFFYMSYKLLCLCVSYLSDYSALKSYILAS